MYLVVDDTKYVLVRYVVDVCAILASIGLRDLHFPVVESTRFFSFFTDVMDPSWFHFGGI